MKEDFRVLIAPNMFGPGVYLGLKLNGSHRLSFVAKDYEEFWERLTAVLCEIPGLEDSFPGSEE